MFDIIILLFFSLFAFLSGKYIIKRNLLFGGIYYFLFIYSIFSQIGYCFFPELSIIIHAYFGKKYYYSFYYFNFLSFLFTFLIFRLLHFKMQRIKQISIRKINNKSPFYLFLFVMIIYFSYLIIFFFVNYNEISYATVSDPDFINIHGIFFKIFSYFFKILVPLSVLFYGQYRFKDFYKSISFMSKPMILYLFLISIILLFIISNKNGSRTDLVALMCGIVILELKIGITKKKILKLIAFPILLLLFLIILENTRESKTDFDIEIGLIEKLLLKDYYSPAHMLYTVLNFNFVDPVFVIKSNFANSFFALNVDYLQIPITELINPGIASRSQGYAFYLFTEGYMFMGFMGFLYNAIILFCGIYLWFLFYNVNNKYFSIIIMSLFSTQIVNIARGQSSYFVKDIFTYIIPMIIIFFLSSGLFYNLLIKKFQKN